MYRNNHEKFKLFVRKFQGYDVVSSQMYEISISFPKLFVFNTLTSIYLFIFNYKNYNLDKKLNICKKYKYNIIKLLFNIQIFMFASENINYL